MTSSSKSSAAQNHDDADDDEIEIISERIVKRSSINTQLDDEDEDDDDVVFVCETRSPQLNPKPSAPTVEEYLGVRDGTIPKILGRIARLNQPRRKTSSSDASSPRVVTIGEYTKARMGKQLDIYDDADDDEEEEQSRLGIRTPKRRIDFDDSSTEEEDDYEYVAPKKRKLRHSFE